ncbi:MAG: F-type H+-transporting ATPase subunit b [Paraglaciecola sp.]|jgi:F-type H+-transporting ATPase subunit b
MLFLLDFSPIKPDLGLILWSALFFILFWVIMGKMAFGPIKDALLARENDIQDSLDQAKQARKEMANLKSENEALLAQAREERTAILKEAKEVAANFEAEQRGKAKEKIQKMIADAKQEITNMKMEAVTDLKNQAGNMAVEIAEKVIRQTLKNDGAQTKLVSQLVKEIKLN